MTCAPHPLKTILRNAASRTEPFVTADEAWLWTMAALIARREGARIVANAGRVQRPCEPDDVIRCLDRLYRQRRIDLTHARVLRKWGERQAVPDRHALGDRADWHLWREAIDRLDWPLRVKGIVAGPPDTRVAAALLVFPGGRRCG